MTNPNPKPTADVIELAKVIAQNKAYPWRDVQMIAESLIIAVTALEANAKPALGGKEQQYRAQEALSKILPLHPHE